MKDSENYTYLMININDMDYVNKVLNNIYKEGLVVVHHECDNLLKKDIERKHPKLKDQFTGGLILKLLVYDKNKDAINKIKCLLENNDSIYASENKEEAIEDIITFFKDNLFEVFSSIEFFSSYEYLFNKNNISRKYIDNQEIELVITSCNVFTKMG